MKLIATFVGRHTWPTLPVFCKRKRKKKNKMKKKKKTKKTLRPNQARVQTMQKQTVHFDVTHQLGKAFCSLSNQMTAYPTHAPFDTLLSGPFKILLGFLFVLGLRTLLFGLAVFIALFSFFFLKCLFFFFFFYFL